MASGPKVWLITGASRGLGRALAEAALARGDAVVGTSRDGRAGLDAGAGRLDVLALDVKDPAAAGRVIEDVDRLHGRLDVLVNNAGSGLLGALEESSDAEAAEVFEVNFFGPLRLIRAALPMMRRRRSGRIINVSSIAGLAPMAGSSLYAAAKFALGGMSQSLAAEVEPLGIGVTVVEPGAFRTDFLSDRSIRMASGRIDDYGPTSGAAVRKLGAMSGNQAGDPARAAAAILALADAPDPPLHLLLGTDALDRARAQLGRLAADFDRWEPTTRSTDFAGADAAGP